MTLPLPGQTFEGRYLVEEHIGSGGFAEVFKARGADGRLVAIKVLVPLHAEWAQNDPILERFEREGRLLGQLRNEHTVRMIEMGRTSDGVSPFIVFEYVDGEDLAVLIEQRGAMSSNQVLRILEQVCSALGEAHRLGVMHRDIKPANIMVYEHMGMTGLVKLLDFGIAKPTHGLDNGSNDLTSAGMVLGTPRYMAPEQFTGARAAPTSDIYSLGLVAFELVTGNLAIDATTTTGIFRQQLSPEEFKIPKSANIPSGLRAIIEKMTRKKRAERYQTVDEVLVDLRALAQAPAPQPERSINASHRKLLVVLGVLVALIILVASILITTPPPLPDTHGTVAEAPPVVEDPDRPHYLDLPPARDPKPEVVPEVVAKPAAPTRPPVVDEILIPLDESGNRVPPPPDDIKPLKLSSAAAAKNVAARAITMGDWDRVIAACKPYGEELTFCARWLADAYRSRGDVEQACYWFQTVKAEKTGLNCPYERLHDL